MIIFVFSETKLSSKSVGVMGNTETPQAFPTSNGVRGSL